MDADTINKDEKPIGFRDLWGEWVTENGTEFRIFGNEAISFITFHKTYKWGKCVREIKHFINHVNNGEFYFEMEKEFYELWYCRGNNSIQLKKVTCCKKKKYEFNKEKL